LPYWDVNWANGSPMTDHEANAHPRKAAAGGKRNTARSTPDAHARSLADGVLPSPGNLRHATRPTSRAAAATVAAVS